MGEEQADQADGERESGQKVAARLVEREQVREQADRDLDAAQEPGGRQDGEGPMQAFRALVCRRPVGRRPAGDGLTGIAPFTVMSVAHWAHDA